MMWEDRTRAYHTCTSVNWQAENQILFYFTHQSTDCLIFIYSQFYLENISTHPVFNGKTTIPPLIYISITS
jgi:hypothetical protein